MGRDWVVIRETPLRESRCEARRSVHATPLTEESLWSKQTREIQIILVRGG